MTLLIPFMCSLFIAHIILYANYAARVRRRDARDHGRVKGRQIVREQWSVAALLNFGRTMK